MERDIVLKVVFAIFLVNVGYFLLTGFKVAIAPSILAYQLNGSTSFSMRTLMDTPTEHHCPDQVIYHHMEFMAYVEQGTIKWDPRPDRFLLAYCYGGRTSNNVKCLRTTALAAAILNRTLLINDNPNDVFRKIDRMTLLDVDRMRTCFGNNTITLFSHHLKSHPTIEVTQVVCWGGQACSPSLNGSHASISAEKQRHVKLSPTAEVYSQILPSDINASQLLSAVGEPSRKVLYLGVLNGVGFREYPNVCGPRGNLWEVDKICRFLGGFQPLPFVRSPQCQSEIIFMPPRAIREAARNFTLSVVGEERYLAFHWRRGDFRKYCQLDSPIVSMRTCFLPVGEVGRLLWRRAQANNISHAFVLSNANESERKDLENTVLSLAGSKVNLVMFGSHGFAKHDFSRKVWARGVKGQFHGWSPSVEIAFEKSVAAQADVFLGTPKSTFTHDIEHMRYGLRTASSRDAYICQEMV